MVYKKFKEKVNAVINLCPYIPLDKGNETSCYATLLLHIPWPFEGENNLLANNLSAVSRLNSLFETGNVPDYLPPFFERIRRSNEIFQTNTSCRSNDNEICDDDNDSEDETGWEENFHEEVAALDTEEQDSVSSKFLNV